jgi:heat shock protein HtpX
MIQPLVMSASSQISCPPRRSLAAWSALAALMVISAYLITLCLAAACIYFPYLLLESGFNAGGQLFLQELALAACGVVMGLTMLWSLVPRREKMTPPGPRLEPRDHPRLFAEIQVIATALNEPVPQDVYLTGTVNAFVAEWGGGFRRRRRRVMGLGLPLMQVLTLAQFRAVLAHEFGHYYSGDTRLGPAVYKGRATMVRTLLSLTRPSAVLQAITRLVVARLIYHAVTRVLLAYWKVFLRATQLVSRKQEFRADELACNIAGSQALVEGLRAIHAGSFALPVYWQQDIVPALQQGCLPPVLEGFSRFLVAPKVAEAVKSGLDQELREPRTDAYDSHPPLRDRIAAAQRRADGRSSEDDSPAVSLIDSLPEEEERLLKFINPQLDLAAFQRVSWDAIGEVGILPAWRKARESHADLLWQVTAESLTDAVRNLRALGSRIPDPKGMLLTREQRDQRAASLLGMALGLLLVDAGWKPCAPPGEFYLTRGDERLNPFLVVQDLAAGKIAGEAWIDKCAALGITGLSLFGSAAAAPATISKA